MASTTGKDLVVRLIDDVDQLKRSYAELDSRTASMQSQMSMMQSDLGLMRGAIGATQRTFEKMVTHLEAFAEAIGEGSAENEETRRELEDLKRRVAALESAAAR